MKEKGFFEGYQRENGTAGTRNYVGVIATVVCANHVAKEISFRTPGSVHFTHQQGCCQTPTDIERVNRTLVGLGKNPNLHSVLLVSLGCESTSLQGIAEEISKTGKKVETLTIQEVGGSTKAVALGIAVAQRLVREASTMRKSDCGPEKLVLGLKCGSSDTTSGIVSNPSLGAAVNLFIQKGSSAVLGETTEFIGAEHLLAKQAKDKETGRKIIEFVERMENRAKSIGVDMRGGQPTGGNIKGGLTTIEEKSLGAIAKAGASLIQDVFEYGDQVKRSGLSVMDSPGREPELLTGLAAAGCNIIAFTTGRGAPQGFPFVPVAKITGNAFTATSLEEHIDLDLSRVLKGEMSLPEAGEEVFDYLLKVASGEMTKAEINGYYDSMDIFVIGPVI